MKLLSLKASVEKRLKPFWRLYLTTRDLGYTGLMRGWIFADMCYCRLKFGANAREYKLYRFDRLKNRFRKNYLLKYDQYKTYAYINHGLEKRGGKAAQYETLGSELVGRDWLQVDEVGFDDILAFAEKHGKVLFKPCHGSCGEGIFVVDYGKQGKDGLIDAVDSVKGQRYLCEEYIVQHPVIAALHPNSVNTVRALSLFDGETVQILATTLKLGISDCVVDNIRHDGLGASIDIKTGIVFTPGYDFDRNEYMIHPESGVQIIGTKIPNWEKVLDIIEKGARIAARNPLIGWDIAVTENGANIVELNNRPGTHIIQMYDLVPKGEPVYRYMKKYPEKLRKLSRKDRKRIREKIR